MCDGLRTLRYSGGCVNCYNGEMMEQLTREELELLLNVCLDAQCNLDHLEMKLQRMIDDCCDHLGDDRGEDNFCNKCKRTVT